MGLRNISRETQMKVRRYIEYMHEEEKIGSKRGNIYIQNLSSNLKKELFKETYQKKLRNILKINQFSNNFIDELCSKVFEFTAAPDEIICDVNKNFNFSILFS